MLKYNQFEDVLADIKANNYITINGQHYATQESYIKGRVINEQPYDPHQPGQIPNPLSLLGNVLDEEYVTLRRPKQSLDVDVVIHNNPLDKLKPKWQNLARLSMIDVICQFIEESNSGYGDRTYFNSVGENSLPNNLKKKYDIEVMKNTLEPSAVAEQIKNVSHNSLTFLISSSLKNIPFKKQKKSDFESVIAISVDHLFDVERPMNTGYIWTSDPENTRIDTANKSELNKYNTFLDNKRRKTVEQFKQLGIPFVQAVYEGKSLPPYGFELEKFDRDLAEATKFKTVKLRN